MLVLLLASTYQNQKLGHCFGCLFKLNLVTSGMIIKLTRLCDPSEASVKVLHRGKVVHESLFGFEINGGKRYATERHSGYRRTKLSKLHVSEGSWSQDQKQHDYRCLDCREPVRLSSRSSCQSSPEPRSESKAPRSWTRLLTPAKTAQIFYI
ncbi:Hypothetical_protein [Hexamita inflata]|uniref:Hypothetical_protein n=1 Tax=Hexamita inflata TaxID=28002 RepID=A0AA86QNY0_9EUKA|nr:Hypothetical protein HINF_LOCUS49288 [Hexamita inflata]